MSSGLSMYVGPLKAHIVASCIRVGEEVCLIMSLFKDNQSCVSLSESIHGGLVIEKCSFMLVKLAPRYRQEPTTSTCPFDRLKTTY